MRRTSPSAPHLRAQLAERLRACVADLAERLDLDPSAVAFANHLARAEQLDAGRPVEVYGWELKGLALAAPVAPMTRYVLAADGELREAS